jgi:hypothetical protein
MLPTVAAMTRSCHPRQRWSLKNFFACSWPGTRIFPISDSKVARITGVSHHYLGLYSFPVHYEHIKTDYIATKQMPTNFKKLQSHTVCSETTML